jgi:ribokinase
MIAVAGSVNMDLVALVPHVPVAGETVLGRELARHHGGKGANQAVAAARLGGAVRFHGAVGSDAFGDELAAGLRAEGIDIGGLVRTKGASGCALINVGDGGENAISVLAGANLDAPMPADPWPPELRWLVLQLEIPLPAVVAWARAARLAGVPVLLNAAPVPTGLPAELLAVVDTLVVNEGELAMLCGGDLVAAAAMGPRRVVVTLGERGAVALDEGRRLEQKAHAVTAVDTTGAGDTFAGALAASLWQGRSFADGLERAGVAAALACTRPGARAGMPSEAELEAALTLR